VSNLCALTGVGAHRFDPVRADTCQRAQVDTSRSEIEIRIEWDNYCFAVVRG